MTVIKNNHATALGVGGVSVPANGGTAEIAKWDSAKNSNAVKIWLAQGVIEVVGETKSPKAPAMPVVSMPGIPPVATDEDLEKADLIAKLQALGVERTKATGLQKLRDLLVEAEKPDA